MIIIYYLSPSEDPRAEKHADLVPALSRAKELRDLGFKHVSISMDDPNSIGKPGVDSVIDGRTPDGQEYTWRKRRA